MKTKHPCSYEHNRVSWTPQSGDVYHVTGLLRDGGKRFPRMVFSNWNHANAINLWRGTVWLVRDGKRYAVKRVWNW